MITECAAILAVTLCMVVILVRSRNGDYAVSILPLTIVPAAHLIFGTIFQKLRFGFGAMPYQMSVAFADIAALGVACLCVFALSAKVKSRRNRKVYLVLCGGYNIILTCALISQMFAPLLENVLELS